MAFPPHPEIAVNGVLSPNCSSLKLLGIILDPKLTAELHFCSLTLPVSQKVGLFRKCSRIYSSDDVAKNCFYSVTLPHFEYCHSVWISAAESNLKLLDFQFNLFRRLLLGAPTRRWPRQKNFHLSLS